MIYPTITCLSLGKVSVFLLKGRKLVLIDTGFPGSEDIICQKMQEKGLNPKEIGLILLTHGHEDHFGSAGALKTLTGAQVAIHKYDADNLRKGINGRLHPTRELGRRVLTSMEHEKSSIIPGLEPDMIIDEEFGLENYGVPGKVISTPGHTPGSLSIVLDSGEVIVGDLLMGFFPKTKPNYPIFADNIFEVEDSIRKIIEYSPVKIYASHGGPFETAAVMKMLRERTL